MSNSLETMQELVKEDIELMKEIIAEDLIPLIQFREQIEKKEFNKAFNEMKKLEGEV
ncbi:hypothetical protein LCGC14_0572220 [marine sediment metagenome]|uniref:Uncharacterized protein n=1 Tax=marine sediment metagenome TaxID=412755 RepID=A0A0F9RP05_9ZZZZ